MGSFSGPPGVSSELQWSIAAEVLSEDRTVPNLLHF
jgi:hypothetical protein